MDLRTASGLNRSFDPEQTLAKKPHYDRVVDIADAWIGCLSDRLGVGLSALLCGTRLGTDRLHPLTNALYERLHWLPFERLTSVFMRQRKQEARGRAHPSLQ